ncbi:chemotaxis protein CheB [Methylocaldum szegediense]
MNPGISFAFLLAQHLSPDHDSKLAEIRAKNVRLPIREARAGMR